MKTTKKKMKTKCYSKTTIRVVTGVEEKSGNSTSSSDSNRRRSARKQILKKKRATEEIRLVPWRSRQAAVADEASLFHTLTKDSGNLLDV